MRRTGCRTGGRGTGDESERGAAGQRETAGSSVPCACAHPRRGLGFRPSRPRGRSFRRAAPSDTLPRTLRHATTRIRHSRTHSEDSISIDIAVPIAVQAPLNTEPVARHFATPPAASWRHSRSSRVKGRGGGGEGWSRPCLSTDCLEQESGVLRS